VPPSRITADLIFHAYETMKCAAFGVGAYDLSLGIQFLRELDSRGTVPILSANLLDPQGKTIFRPFLVQDVGSMKVGIFSLVSADLKRDKVPNNHQFTLRDPLETAREVVAKLRAAGAEVVLLLTDMEGRASRRLAMELPIDFIVGSDRRNQISLPILVQNTYIMHLDRGGRSIGRLEVARAPTQNTGSSEAGSVVLGKLTIRNSFVQLRLEIPDHPAVGPMVTKTLEELSRIQAEVASAPPEKNDEDCGKEYVGIAVCRRCHEDRFRGWSPTQHAHAYQTLVAKNRQFDVECVACHAVAFECEQDKIDWKALERFVNVQCEACHGPGSLHVQSKGTETLTAGADLAAACPRCHTEERSPEFDFADRFGDVCAAKKN